MINQSILPKQQCSSVCTTCCIIFNEQKYCGLISQCQSKISIGLSIAIPIALIIFTFIVLGVLFWKLKDRKIDPYVIQEVDIYGIPTTDRGTTNLGGQSDRKMKILKN